MITNLFTQSMTNVKTKKRVSLEVSRGLHEKIKQLAHEREETMVSLVINALHDFLETEHQIHLANKLCSKDFHALSQYPFN